MSSKTTDAQIELAEARANAQALTAISDAVGSAERFDEAMMRGLEATRAAFGWAYASYWSVNRAENALMFQMESGSVSPEFRQATMQAKFREGEGLSGKTWRARDLVFVPDLGQVTDCCRAPAARQAGVKAGVCLPIMVDGNVIGTMDFFSLEPVTLSDERTSVLRGAARMLSGLAGRMQEAESADRVQSAVQSASTALMMIDRDFVVTYINQATRDLLQRAESEIRTISPGFSVDRMVGSCIDMFHQRPEHQRKLLADPKNLPHRAKIKVGKASFALTVSAVINRRGEYVGNTLEWSDITQQLDAEGQVDRLIGRAVDGELDDRMDTRGYQGFMKTLGDGINRTLDAISSPLAEAVRVSQALADGDLTQQMTGDFQGQFSTLRDSLNSCTGTLRNMVDEIRQASASITSASSEIAQGTGDLSQRTAEQAASLEETASTMEELTETVRQNAENAKTANQLASNACEQAERGGEVVGSAVNAMAEISSSSKKIADIIGVIDEIAFQTNLLALNAAVEAARAGEQGRGFAVVATEVRNLAQRSAGAAKEIKSLIKDSVEKVDQGQRLVDDSGKTLQEIVKSVKRVSSIIAEIAAASQEQSQGIEQVNKVVVQLDEVTQQNAALVEQAASSSESMNQQARSLEQLMSFFRCGGAAAAPPPIAEVVRTPVAVPAARPAPVPAVKNGHANGHANGHGNGHRRSNVALEDSDWQEF